MDVSLISTVIRYQLSEGIRFSCSVLLFYFENNVHLNAIEICANTLILCPF